MKLQPVPCGFVPLNDSAVLVAAVEMGFASAEGIDLQLKREASWSNIRDKLSLGVYPVAHLLSPMAVATTIGNGPVSMQVDAPFVMNLNGNVLVARPEVAKELADTGASARDAMATGHALAHRIAQRGIRIGVPFPHSMHLLLTRYLLEGAGADLSKVEFAVAPPPILPEMMQAGEVDAFMVGEPWGSIAVERWGAEILLPGAAIWSAAPEKVLGARRGWLEDNPGTARQLIRALRDAAVWCSRPQSIPVLAEILSGPRYLNAPADTIQRGLEGDLMISQSGASLKVAGFVRFSGPSVNFPWRSGGSWIGAQGAPLWGVRKNESQRIGYETFRSDLFRQALQDRVDLPSASVKPEGDADGFFDGRIFTVSER